MRALVVLTQPPLPEGGAPGKTAIGLLRGLAATRGRRARDRRAAADSRFRARCPATCRRGRRRCAAGPCPARLQPVTPAARRAGRRLRRARPGRRRRRRPRPPRGDRDRLVRRAASTLPSLVHLHYLARRDRDLGAPWSQAVPRGARRVPRRARCRSAGTAIWSRARRSSRRLRAAAPARRSCVAPLSLDPAAYRPAPLDGPPTAGLIGTAAWPPTAAAMRELATTSGRASAGCPGAELLVAGRGTAASAASARSRARASVLPGLLAAALPARRGKRDEGQGARGDRERRPRRDDRRRRRGDRAFATASSCSRQTRASWRGRRRAAAGRQRARRERGAAARADFDERYCARPGDRAAGRALPPNGR